MEKLIIAFAVGATVGAMALHFYTKHQNAKVIAAASDLFGKAIPNNAVIVKGEKGINGGGDAGDGLFWDTGMAIMPGYAALSK